MVREMVQESSVSGEGREGTGRDVPKQVGFARDVLNVDDTCPGFPHGGGKVAKEPFRNGGNCFGGHPVVPPHCGAVVRSNEGGNGLNGEQVAEELPLQPDCCQFHI